MSRLSERLKLLRKQRKLTQRELAIKLNTSPSRIALYETGDRNPDPEMINILADFFDVSADYLLGRVDDPKSHETNVLDELDTIEFHQLEDHLRALPPHAQKQLNDIIIAYLKAFPKGENNGK
jgi:transcriptional regulator with XRE-family HTH domain